MSEWEKVHETNNDIITECLHRIKVPNGYLYRSLIFTHKIESQSVCFVRADYPVEEEELTKIERLIFEGAQTHATILQCKAEIKKLTEENQKLSKYISDCDVARCDNDRKLLERIEQIEKHLVL